MQKSLTFLFTILLTLSAASAPAGNPDHTAPYQPLNNERYDNAGDFYQGLAAVKVNNQWGFINTEGKMVIAPQFNPYQAQFNAYFSDGLVAINFVSAKKSGIEGNDPVGTRWGFADQIGKVVIKPQFVGNYYYPPHFANGLAVISGNFIGTTIKTFGLNTKYGYIDKTGKFVIPQTFDEAYDFSDDLASVKVGSKYGFIDKTGRMVIAPAYDAAGFFQDGIAVVELNGLSYVIDKHNKKIFDQGFQNLSAFTEGLARFEEGGKVGFIDRTGHVKIKPTYQYSSAQSQRLMYFSEGLCPFEMLGEDRQGRITRKFGYFNKDGKTVIETRFDYAGPFNNGIAVVSVNGNYGYINKSGRFVIQPIFANVGNFVDGIARVSGAAGFGDYKFRFIKLH